MAHRQRWLRVAAASGVLSITLAAASLTLAIVSMASPPVFEHGNPAAQEFQAGRMRTLWVLPAFALTVSGWALMQVVTRQPSSLTRPGSPNRSVRSPSTLAVHGLLVVICLLTCGVSLLATVQSIGHSPRPHITDSLAFSGLNIGLAIPAMMLAFFSMNSLQLWCGSAPGVPDGMDSERGFVPPPAESVRSSV